MDDINYSGTGMKNIKLFAKLVDSKFTLSKRTVFSFALATGMFLIGTIGNICETKDNLCKTGIELEDLDTGLVETSNTYEVKLGDKTTLFSLPKTDIEEYANVYLDLGPKTKEVKLKDNGSNKIMHINQDLNDCKNDYEEFAYREVATLILTIFPTLFAFLYYKEDKEKYADDFDSLLIHAKEEYSYALERLEYDKNYSDLLKNVATQVFVYNKSFGNPTLQDYGTVIIDLLTGKPLEEVELFKRRIK